MRKLMWFALGFAAACIPCAYLWLIEELWMQAVIAAAAGLLSLCLCVRIKWFRCVAAVCMGCAAGFLWFQFYAAHYLSLSSGFEGKTTSVTAYCTDYSYETAYGAAVEAAILIEGKPMRVKLYLDDPIDAQPGDTLRGEFRFRVTTPDGSDEPTVHRGKGIFLLGYQSADVTHSQQSEPPAWSIPARQRHRLLEILDAYFPEDTAPFAKALLLGERSGIDYETNTAFKLSGISHVIAVSGLHVSILFSLINIVCLKQRHLVALLGIPALLIFALLAGFSPSIMRACIMQCLMMAAMLLNREYDGPTELAFACLVMLLVNPLVITSVSFQLSVGCMIGIFLFSQRLREYFAKVFPAGRFKKVKNWLISSVSVTLSAMAVTTPLVALYFDTVSLVAILTNVLTLWVISFVFYGIMMVCALSFIWPFGASLISAVVSLPIRYVLLVSKVLSRFPLAAVYTASVYIVIWLVFCYALLAAFLLGKKKKTAVFVCSAVLSLCLALWISWFEPLRDNCRMTVLDVGQGQCILLQSQRKTYLVDCGGYNGEEAADTAAEYLLAQGITRLDGVILTHFDADHSGGVENLLSRIPTQVLFLPAADENAVTQRLTEHAAQVMQVKDNLILKYEDTELTIFGPVVPNSGNESSLAILFRCGECDILITGDRSGFGERMLLKTGMISEVDILVAGHHGSKYASCEELLQATKPKTAVISVGDNSFGHPSQEVLDRFSAIDCGVYRTDIHGNIIIRR